MKVFLFLWGTALMAVGMFTVFLLAKTALHEIEGAIVGLMGVVAFTGGAIVGAIEERR